MNWPLVAQSSGYLRELATLASALTFAVVAVIAYRRPQALKAQAIVGIALACTLVLMVGMAFALSAHNI